MSQSEAPTMIAVDVLVDGLVYDGVARRRGETIEVAQSDLDGLMSRVRIRPRPLLRSRLANRQIGNRVCQVGEVAPAPTLAMALQYHHDWAADFINAGEMGVPLPPRKGERPKSAPELVKLRAVKPLFLHGPTGHLTRQGTEFEATPTVAADLLSQGLVEVVTEVPGQIAAGSANEAPDDGADEASASPTSPSRKSRPARPTAVHTAIQPG